MHLIKTATILAALAALTVSAASGFSATPRAPARAGPASPAAPPAAPPVGDAQAHLLDRSDLEAWLDGMVPYGLKAGDIAGGVVVVVKDGKVLLEKGYGYADVAAKTPMDPFRSEVRIGSTSKLFTWTAVMQLVQAGKLDLDRDVNDYLDLKIAHKFGKPITLRDLMNHRAGFEEGLKSILAIDPKGAETTEQYLKNHPRPLLFAPGEVPAYSNYGAALAGYIVQRVSGEPFERYVERHIFLPLGMTHSSFDNPLPDRFKPNLAKGYRTASGEPSPYELVITRPAGSMTTTADDMSRFMLAQLQQGRFGDAQILSPATTALMHTPTETNLPGFATMAHGFFLEQQNGQTLIGHGGDTIVFHTEFQLIPAAGVGIYYTFSSRGAQDAVYGLRQNLLDGFMDRYFPAPAEATAPTLATAAKDAQEIAGRYESSRRIEHGFLSLFYLLQQSTITADPDGTITAPGAFGNGEAKFREVGPQIWRQVGSERALALTRVGGVKTVMDSQDPSSVLQASSFARSPGLNLNVMLLSVLVLVWTLALWGLSPLLRRGDRATPGLSPEARRLRLFLRAAAAVDAVYLLGWYAVLAPILSSHVEVYGPALDPFVRIMQLMGLLVIGAAAVGLWAAWRTFRADTTWLSRIWSGVVAAALLGVVWIGLMGGLIGFSLNY